MAVAAWLVYRKAGSLRAAAFPLGLFAVQLALNILWSFVFFCLGKTGLGFCRNPRAVGSDPGNNHCLFSDGQKIAGNLMVPYLAWVGFASFLTWTIWRLNS